MKKLAFFIAALAIIATGSLGVPSLAAACSDPNGCADTRKPPP